jgi:hypothetical protein
MIRHTPFNARITFSQMKSAVHNNSTDEKLRVAQLGKELHVHNSPPQIPILSQMSPVHIRHIPFRLVLILLSHLCRRLPSADSLFLPGFLTTFHKNFSSPMRAVCPAHLIVFVFIVLTMSIKESKSWSSSLCIFLHCRLS